MQLVKIKDVRVGQIWRNSHWDLALIKNVNSERIELHQWNYDIPSDNDYNTTPNYITENDCNWKLIGKFGITHEIKDNRLVEIPRDEFQVDDVILFDESDFNSSKVETIITAFYGENNEYWSLLKSNCCKNRGIYCASVDNSTKKIGIYGVTHEFVNNKEFKE